MRIHEAMVAIMRDAGAITKSKRNTQQGFMFRGIDDMYNQLHGIMAKHGVFCTTECLERTREERPSKGGGTLAFTVVRIKFTFHAEDGSTVHSVIDGEGMDSGDKSTNKALAIGHKYALLQAFLIPTEDIADPDAESPQLGAHDPVVATPAMSAAGAEIADKVRLAGTVAELNALVPAVKKLPESERAQLRSAFVARHAELSSK